MAAAKDGTKTSGITLVSSFAKNAFDEVWAYLQPYGSKEFAHIRVFTDDGGGEMVPTKKGIAIDPEDLPKLAEAVRALIAAVEGRSS